MQDRFRFQGLQIWIQAVGIGNRLYDIADELEDRRLFRFADQVRGAALSVSNNIAEGAGSTSDREFAQFLKIARRSVFENANMIVVFAQRGIVTEVQGSELLSLLEQEAQMLTGFAKSLSRRATAKTALAGSALAFALGVALHLIR
jgi:four helix bundle protein